MIDTTAIEARLMELLNGRYTTDNPQNDIEVIRNIAFYKNDEAYLRGMGENFTDISLYDYVRSECPEVYGGYDNQELSEAMDCLLEDEHLGPLELSYWLAVGLAEVREQLKRYEDTGLTPERVAELAKAEQDGKIFSGIEMANLACALKKLKDFEEMERAGRLLVLPFKNRDEVYNVEQKDCIDCEYDNDDLFCSNNKCPLVVKQRTFYVFTTPVGRGVFKTRAEAEMALAQLRNNGEN